ncbi:MAG: ABC transporter permease subunit [Planctomycetaceae bacterium]|nr:ABC transporter permease subunit [Planctomycetaceae bacterium]
MKLTPEAPLLVKELGEQSLQTRTYIIRGLYGLLLYLGGLMMIYGEGGALQSNVSLGQGRMMFWNIVYLEALGIMLFLPAMTAGSLAGEKERESLSLLLLTTLPPWSILWQKLLSRLIPMLTLVVLSFPLLAAAYSFGGVPTQDLFGAGIVLIVWTAQLAAISLACSSFCRTTVSALVTTYVFVTGAVMFFSFTSGGGRIFAYVPFVYANGVQLNSSPQGLIRCGLLLAAAMVAARVCLFSRAFSPPSNALLKLFQGLDRFWNEMNDVTGGVVLVDDNQRYPAFDPVAWRETAKKSLGTFRYLFRVLVVIETPILLGCQMTNLQMTNFIASSDSNSVSWLLYTTWMIGTVLVCVHAASVISGERARQTLGTLLTTPLTGRRIVSEKLSGVRRLLGILMVPLLTVVAFQHWFWDLRWDLTYAVRSAVLSLVLLSALMWMCCWFGLWMKSQLRAIVASLVTVIVLIAVPIVVSYFLVTILGWQDPFAKQVSLVSPASLIHASQTVRGSLLPVYGVKWDEHVWFWSAVGAWGGIALALRLLCLSNADGWLGRPWSVKSAVVVSPQLAS